MPSLEPVYILPHSDPILVQIRAHSQTGKGVGELGLDFFFLQDTIQCKLHFDPFNLGVFYPLAGLGLRNFVQAFFSSCDEQGLLIVVHGLLIAVASLLVEQGA